MEGRTQLAGAAGGLDIELSGPAGGTALLFHTGTPSAGTLYGALADAAAQRGLRTITYSRPGYGSSRRRPGRSIADCAADVAAIADELGIERFFTVGWSGGGPHALACAALLPERTIAAATIAAVAPRHAAGLDWLAGMGDENVAEFAAAQAGEAELLVFLEQSAGALAASSGADVAAELGDLLSAVDRAALTMDFADYLSRAMRVGLAEGVWGWLDDDLAFMRDWGFALERIERPVTVWQGSEDRFVPFAHGHWLAAHVAGARARLLDGEGHLSILLGSYGPLLDDLLASGG
ncbi:MAG TPA: alpha/beta hydrolase [Solirubrobacteraceae bacterium]|nr:alpha/beta hydrolase [Solirubrobacteraceae bacterium]